MDQFKKRKKQTKNKNTAMIIKPAKDRVEKGAAMIVHVLQLTVCVWASLFAKQEIFFQRCFLETIFSPEGDTLKSNKSKGMCSMALKFGH